MNRRDFLGRVCASIVGTAVVAHVPLAWIPTRIKSSAAIEYLVKVFNAYGDARPNLDWTEQIPAAVYATPLLFNAYAHELPPSARVEFTQYPGSLVFRGVPLLEWRTNRSQAWAAIAVDAHYLEYSLKDYSMTVRVES